MLSITDSLSPYHYYYIAHIPKSLLYDTSNVRLFRVLVLAESSCMGGLRPRVSCTIFIIGVPTHKETNKSKYPRPTRVSAPSTVIYRISFDMLQLQQMTSIV